MEITLELIENKNPLTLAGLDNRIFLHLIKDQGFSPIINKNYFFSKKGEPGMFGCRDAVLIVKKMTTNISELYTTITNAGYSIKNSKIIRQDGITNNKTRLAENYATLRVKSKNVNKWKPIK